jgi:hypothetical protein
LAGLRFGSLQSGHFAASQEISSGLKVGASIVEDCLGAIPQWRRNMVLEDPSRMGRLYTMASWDIAG